jgi:hypothetical protein
MKRPLYFHNVEDEIFQITHTKGARSPDASESSDE